MSQFIQANTNGRLHDATEPSIAPLDRGFLYGDAIYEVWRTYDGVLFAFAEHWERLNASARALHFDPGLTAGDLKREIERTARAYRTATDCRDDLYIRLQLTRGGGTIGLDPALADNSNWVLLTRVLPPVQFSGDEAGYRLEIAETLRRNPPESLNPAWKTGNYLNNLLCLHEARRRGADEVLMLNTRGFICEAAVCNVAFVRDGAVVTPPLEAGILAGVTRKILLQRVAPSAGIQVAETDISPADLASFSECFLTSTTRDIVPVRRIGARTFACGPETVTARLQRAFADYVQEYARAHGDWRI